MNLYGIFAKAKPVTEVGFGVWIPDSSDSWKNIMSLSSKAEFDATTVGFGLTPTIGVGGGWFALDMNFTWPDIEALEKPAFAFVFGPRFGKTFKFKKPETNIAFWAGGFRLKINTGTSGSLPLDDVLSGGSFETKLDNAYLKVNEAQMQIDAWWNGLSSLEQANPVSKTKYESANRVLSQAGQLLDAANEAWNTAASSTVNYSLDKQQKDLWNFIVGTQYQLNKHWMVRLEYGFLKSRSQFFGGLQYRFGL